MCPKTSAAVRFLMTVGIGVAIGAGALLGQSTRRMSVDSDGVQGNRDSRYAAISADGRFVAFASDASNLVAGDTNGMEDVFVHDRESGATTRVSVDSRGVQGDGVSSRPAISADGRCVAFGSAARNLVAGGTHDSWNIFVHDRQTGETTLVSVDSQAGQGNGGTTGRPAISADGRLVTFESGANNLVAGDTNDSWDIFVHDRQTRMTTRVSMDSQGGQGNDDSLSPAISADGRLVGFESHANNLVTGDTNDSWDIFVHDRQTGMTTRVSVDSQGRQGDHGGGDAMGVLTISAEGRFVAFASPSTNLVADDTNGWNDIFVHDRQTGETTRVSVDFQGGQGNGNSTSPAITAAGRFVAFWSWASTLVPGDTNDSADVFRHDRQTGETVRVSVDSQGGQGNGASAWPTISGDGRFVAFSSWATNLVLDDTNNGWDIFVHDRTAGPCTFPATWSNYGSGWPGTNGVPGFAATSNPVLCSTVSISADNASGADTEGFLLAGFSRADFPTAWGGTLLVRPAMVSTVLVPAAGFSLSAAIPCDDSLCGLTLFAQLVEMDPGASRGISFTPGLELRLGVQ